jgi:hypothetical protein
MYNGGMGMPPLSSNGCDYIVNVLIAYRLLYI